MTRIYFCDCAIRACSTPRCGFDLPDSSVHALDLAYHALRFEHRGDGVQVLEIMNFDVENDVVEIRRSVAEFDVVDIGARVADHRRDLAQRARLVQGTDDDPRRKKLR